MPYEYDIFVSYKRNPQWTPWVRKFFHDALHAFIGPNFFPFRVFIDDQIETGAAWPLVLQQKLLHSRILVPVLTPEYFSSDWCVREMSTFFEREQALGYRTPANTSGLILPLQLHDGDHYPSFFRSNVQMRDIQRFAVRTLVTNPNTPLGEQFELEMQAWAPEVCRIIGTVPAHDPGWTSHTGNSFFPQLHQTGLRCGAPPRLNP